MSQCATALCQEPLLLWLSLFCCLLPLLQLIIGDSGLQLNIRKLVVSGTLIMGTPDCPITSGDICTIT